MTTFAWEGTDTESLLLSRLYDSCIYISGCNKCLSQLTLLDFFFKLSVTFGRIEVFNENPVFLHQQNLDRNCGNLLRLPIPEGGVTLSNYKMYII